VSDEPQLTIGYSVLAERLKNLIYPSLTIPHKVLVSVQNPTNTHFVKNSQVKYLESNDIGVTKSRNLVLSNCDSEILVFGDDDAVFLEDGINQCLEYFMSNPNVDLILAQSIDANGILRKKYKNRIYQLNKFNCAKAGTIEIMVRARSAKIMRIKFDEEFGAGSKKFLGDEYIFITDLLKIGGKAVFLPITIATHPSQSSGVTSYDQATMQARAKVFNRVFGFWAPLVRALFFIKNFRKTGNLLDFLKFIVGK
jgi:hypothetical protein